MNLSLKYLIVIVSLLFGLKAQGQVTFYQDVFNGGVTGAGFSTGGVDGGSGDFNLLIDNSSSIRKAFLMCGQYGACNDVTIDFDGHNITFNSETRIDPFFLTYPEGTYSWNSYIHCLEVTQFIDPFQQLYHIIIPPQFPFLNISKYSSFYLIVLYENSSSPITGVSIYTNDKNMTNLSTSFVDYQFQNYLPLDLTKPVGFSLNSDIVVDTLFDNTDVFFNLQYNGHIGGDENLYSGTGVKGDFNYENNQLLGLGNDNEDSQMFVEDGLAEISTFLNSTDSFFDLSFQENQLALFNNYLTFHLAYTTTCDTFSVSVPSDTTICRGASLQLNASGGSNYEWQPATDLSCSSCPNPVFNGDSTQLYTVRIWNNDSCSVVRPVKVKVQSCAGLDEEMLASAFSSYPNPSNGNFTLENEALNTAVLKVEVIDLLGKIHYSETINFDHKHTLALSFAAGTYILKVSDEQHTFSTQWIERIVVE